MMPPVSGFVRKSDLARIIKSCLTEYQNCDVNDIAGYIEGQPQVFSLPLFPDEDGTMIRGMDTADKSLRKGTAPA